MKLKLIFDSLTVNKYYQMKDDELENEAAKWHIGGYVVPFGSTNIIDRQVIIDALIKKDGANNSRIAIFISIVALMISIISIIK